jgi:transglutaminase-like putative cysteine protease
MPTRSRAFFLLILTLTLVSWARAGSATPDWVRQAASATLPVYEPDTKATVLLDETRIAVSGPGEYREHYRRVVKILRPEGRAEANLEVYFRDKEKVHQVHCWSIDRNGKEFELKDKDFVERGEFSDYELYNDLRLRTATCPGADPGAVIAFEYEVQRREWVNELESSFQESIPVYEARVALKLPPGWEFKTLWANGDSVEPTKSDDGSWEWSLHNLAAIEHEPLSPTLRALCRRMELIYYPPESGPSNAGSWEALGRWYTQLTADRRIPTRELSQKAQQLVSGKPDFDGKARALASFMQSDVRYVAIQIGIGGYQPHPAGDIFRARYGDCKDKATLLSTMLHEVGIESDYVLIDTHRGDVIPSLSSPGFDHAILAIELPASIDAGRYRSVVSGKSGTRFLIFDPTDPYTPLGELRGDLQDTYALLMTGGSGELIHTPLAPPEANLLSRTGHFALSADGGLAGEIVESRSGDHAMYERASLMHASQQERTQQLERRLNRSLKGFNLEELGIQQLEQLQQNLQLTFKLTDPGYAQIRGPLMLVRPRVLGEKALALEHKPRHLPFQFKDASRETDVYEFDLPKDYAVDDIPDPVKVDMGFATYQSKIEVTGSKLKYSREFVRREVLLKPEQTEALRKMQSIIGADENVAVVLKRAP